MKLLRKKSVWILIVLLLIGGGASWTWRQKKLQAKSPTFTAVKVVRGDMRIQVTTNGLVQPENRLVIKPQIAGRIEEVLIKEGQAVKKGQILAWMSSTDRAALIDGARAKGGEEAKYWEDMYRPAPIVAPLDGVIIANSIEPGQTLGIADQAFIMSDRLIVIAQVDETDIAKVKLGQEAEISLDAFPQTKIMGKVLQIAYEARTVNNVTIYDVQIRPDEVPGFMRSGMSANINFLVAEKKDILILPMASIRQSPDKKTTVLIAAKVGAPDDKPTSIQIETGLNDGKTIEVASGLNEGDEVLQPNFKAGERENVQTNPFMPMPGRNNRSGRSGGNPPPPPPP